MFSARVVRRHAFLQKMKMIHCLVFLLATAAQGSDVITCGASPSSVTPGEDVHITCYFPYDVSQVTRISVSVDHYSYNAPTDSLPDRLVDCLKINTPSFSCKARVGCDIDGEIKKSLTFNMTTVSAKDDGQFLCQVMPSEGEIPDTDPCFLSVRHAPDVLTTTETTEIATSTDAVVVRVDHESHAEKNTTNTGLVAAVVISNILMVAAVISAVIIVILWRRSVKKRKEREGMRYSAAAQPALLKCGEPRQCLAATLNRHKEDTATDDAGLSSQPLTPLLVVTLPPAVISPTAVTQSPVKNSPHAETPPEDAATPPAADHPRGENDENILDQCYSSCRIGTKI